MKSLGLILLALIAPNLVHAECLQINEKDIVIQWTAFKTAAKAPVSGKLTSFKLDGKKKGSSVKDVIYGMGVDINTSKINTGNKSRDLKIAQFFFKKMNQKGIRAEVKKITDKSLILTVKMNGTKKNVPLSYTILGNELRARGFVDILDFGASKALQAINKACYALHEGKTWSDVGLELSAQFKRCQ